MTSAAALVNGSLVLGDRDGTVSTGHTIVIGAGGDIERVGPADEVEVPAFCRVIDISGRYVIPGLINAHAHLFADGRPLPSIYANKFLEPLTMRFLRGPLGRRMLAGRTERNVATQLNSGVTTLRSVGDVAYEVVAERDAIERGERIGPRVQASGPLLAVPGGHGAPQIALITDSPEEARRNVRINLRNGANAIKVSATAGVTDAVRVGYAGKPEMTETQIAAVCEEAHSAGVLVAAHAQSKEGILLALRAGVDTIEHGAGMTQEMIELYTDNQRSLRGYSAVIPTLLAAVPLVKLDRSVTTIDDVVHANAELVLDEMLAGIRDAQANGVVMGMGSDSALTFSTHYDIWREMDLLVRYGGLSTAQVLNAATQVNARILGVDDVTGAIEVGMAADLVVLGANPLDGFRALARPEMVVVRGHIIDAPEVKRFPAMEAQLDSL
ncbi:metal-dependent hydrolase family protein [Nocardia neocaledoniensis]|uniref:metal-dependent hydrolase family protein n=1 Tax=Nocardia neocaledoniensis TaxID=236511 RepID=UPI0024554EAD|nr:amidohydrolase family protein [Nocardia neocaledoniensis]